MNAVNIQFFCLMACIYAGMSVHNGVDFELIDAPAQVDSSIKLIGAENYPDGIFGIRFRCNH